MKKKKENIIDDSERKTQDMSAVRDYDGEKSNSAKFVEYIGDDYKDEPAVDNSIEGRAANIWYHYKWHIIISLFFAAVLFVGISQIATRERYDFSVMYSGPTVIADENAESLADALSDVIKNDVNGDGKTKVKIYSFAYWSEAQIEERKKVGLNVDYSANRDAKTNFDNMIFTGECGIMFLDYDLFAAVRDSGGLVTLEDALGYKPEGALDEYGIRLSDIKAYNVYSAFRLMPSDTVVCLRGVSTVGGVFSSKKKAEELFEESKKSFAALVGAQNFEGDGE